MADKYYGFLTAIGKAAVANAAIKGEKVPATWFAVGDGGGSYYAPSQNAAALVNEVWRGPLTDMAADPTNPNVVKFEALIPSDVGGFTAREMAVLDDLGRMIAIANLPDTEIVEFGQGITDELTLQMPCYVESPEVLVWQADPTVILATRQYVSAHIREHATDEDAHPEISAEIEALKDGLPEDYYTKAQTDRLVVDAEDRHNADPAAHGNLQTTLEAQAGSIADIYSIINGGLSSNLFSVTFGDLDGLAVTGVHNVELARIEF